MSPTPLVVFCYGVVEVTVIFLFCLAVLGIPWRFYPLVNAVIPSMAVVWISRVLDLPFGIHTLILTVLYGILLIVIYHVQPLRAFITSVLSIFVLQIYEYLGTMGIGAIVAMPVEDMLKNEFLWLLTGLPHIILFLATSLLIKFMVKAKNP